LTGIGTSSAVGFPGSEFAITLSAEVVTLPTSDIALPPRGINIQQALAALCFLHLRLRVAPRQALRLPAENKGNTLRGAFGSAFRRLVCIPQCRDARHCPLGEACPYKAIFEPSPPAGVDRLTRNQDAPRPFVFRPPLDFETRNSKLETRDAKIEIRNPKLESGVAANLALPSESKIQNPKSKIDPIQNPKSKTTYFPGEVFEFDLILIGKAVDYLPYFVLAFREVTRQGFGLNRARCELQDVRSFLSPVPYPLSPVPYPLSPVPTSPSPAPDVIPTPHVILSGAKDLCA